MKRNLKKKIKIAFSEADGVTRQRVDFRQNLLSLKIVSALHRARRRQHSGDLRAER